MGIFTKFTGFFSSSAPAPTQIADQYEQEQNGDGGGQIAHSDPMDLDVSEAQDQSVQVMPKHAPHPILPHSNAHESKQSKHWATSTGSGEAGPSMVTPIKGNKTPSRPHSSWKRIPAGSFRGDSPEKKRLAETPSRNEGSTTGDMFRAIESADGDKAEVDEEADYDEEPNLPTAKPQSFVSVNETETSTKTQKIRARSGNRLANGSVKKNQARAVKSEAQSATKLVENVKKAKNTSKVSTRATKPQAVSQKSAGKPTIVADEALEEQAGSEEDVDGMAALLNNVVKRQTPRAVLENATPSYQSEKWNAINVPNTTPQVIIKSHPRPSLLSLSRTPSKAHPSGVEPISLLRHTLPVDEDDTSSIEPVQAPEQPEVVSKRSSKKRKATANVEESVGPKRGRHNSPLPDEHDAKQKYVVPLTNDRSSPLGREPPFRPESTPQRILPPPSMFRSKNVVVTGSRQGTPSAFTSVAASSASSKPQIAKTIAPPPLKTPNASKSIRQPRATPLSVPSIAADPNIILRQRSLESFVSGARSALQETPLSVAVSSRRQGTSNRSSSQNRDSVTRNTAKSISEGVDDDDEEAGTALSLNRKPVQSNEREISVKHLSGSRHVSPPRSNVKRKRRMPSFDPAEAGTSATSAGPSATGPKANSRRARTASTKVPAAAEPIDLDGPPSILSIPSDARLRAQGLDDETIQIICEGVANFGRHEELTQRELNSLVQQNTKANNSTAKELWEEVCGQVPEPEVKTIQKFCRRHFHNFTRGAWTEEQDEELREAYNKYPTKWTTISELINRFPEDARLRYRDYASRGTDIKKDIWSLEEEDTLRSVYNDHIELIRAEQAVTKDKTFKNADEDSLIDWRAISDAMGGTRSRLQCFQKWTRLQARETSTNMTVLAILSDTPWRVEEAAKKVEGFSAETKLRALKAIQSTGAISESKIPWRLLTADLGMQHDDMNLALRVLLRNLRGCIPNHQSMKLQDILAELVDKFEEAAPHAPHGFDRVHATVRNASQQNSDRKTPSKTPRRKTTSKQHTETPKRAPRMPSSKRQLKKHSPDNGLNDEVSAPDTARQRKRMRENMRKSGQDASQGVAPEEDRAALEDVAQELRATWTSNSVTPRAKKPIIMPIISQRVAASPQKEDDYEEEQINPSPPSDDEIERHENEDSDGGASAQLDQEVEATVRLSEDDGEGEDGSEVYGDGDSESDLDAAAKLFDIEVEEVDENLSEQGDGTDSQTSELVDHVVTDTDDMANGDEHNTDEDAVEDLHTNGGETAQQTANYGRFATQRQALDASLTRSDISRENASDRWRAVHAKSPDMLLNGQEDISDEQDSVKEEPDSDVDVFSNSVPTQSRKSMRQSWSQEGSAIDDLAAPGTIRSDRSFKHRSPPLPLRSPSVEENMSSESDAESPSAGTVDYTSYIQHRPQSLSRSPTPSEVDTEQNGGSIVYAMSESASHSNADFQQNGNDDLDHRESIEGADGHHITTNGWSPQLKAVDDYEENPESSSSDEEEEDVANGRIYAYDEQNMVVAAESADHNMQLGNGQRGLSNGHYAPSSRNVAKFNSLGHGLRKAPRVEEESSDDSDSDVSSIRADEPPRKRIGRVQSVEL